MKHYNFGEFIIKMKGSAGKVLIVDDDRFVRMALSEALRSWEYEIFEADSVKSAKQAFEEEDPPIILLDIDLPDGSGLDILTFVKEQSPDTIAIMITGNVDVENTVAALRGGAHDFIGKPVRIEELRVTLRNATETRELRREITHVRTEQKARIQLFGNNRRVGDDAQGDGVGPACCDLRCRFDPAER